MPFGLWPEGGDYVQASRLKIAAAVTSRFTNLRLPTERWHDGDFRGRTAGAGDDGRAPGTGAAGRRGVGQMGPAGAPGGAFPQENGPPRMLFIVTLCFNEVYALRNLSRVDEAALAESGC